MLNTNMLHFCCHGSKSDVMMASSVVKTLDFKKVKKIFSELFLAVLVTWSSYCISKIIDFSLSRHAYLTYSFDAMSKLSVSNIVSRFRRATNTKCFFVIFSGHNAKKISEPERFLKYKHLYIFLKYKLVWELPTTPQSRIQTGLH